MESWHADFADAQLGELPDDFPGKQMAAQLLVAGRRPSTWRSYSSKLQRWFDFCTRVQQEQGQPPIPPFPARPAHLLAYLGYLRQEGCVAAGSLQPYLSAINSWHADLGLPKPAVGHSITRLRRGYGELQPDFEEGETVVGRRPIPADTMLSIFQLARASSTSHSLRRAATANVLCFAFMLRADSCVRLRRKHISFTEKGLVLQVLTKTRGRDVSTTVHRPGQDEVFWLLWEWMQLNPGSPDSLLWALDGASEGEFQSTCIVRWLRACCDALNLHPPVGEKWGGHSHRSGGATAALSIDVSLPAIARFGIWDHIASLQPYLDPAVGPSAAALFFFEHLLKPSLAEARAQLQALQAQLQAQQPSADFSV